MTAHLSGRWEVQHHEQYTDHIFKVKSLMIHFNEVFSKMSEPLPEIWAIDEAMKPYFGCHSLKQSIREKPVRFGYKVWSL